MGFREYEVRNKPLFASMRRAKAALSQKQCTPCEIDYFFDYIETHYDVDSQNIEFVTFYDYYDHQGKFQYNIAYIYTTPSLKMRNVVTTSIFRRSLYQTCYRHNSNKLR